EGCAPRGDVRRDPRAGARGDHRFATEYGPKYPKAVTTLKKDADALLSRRLTGTPVAERKTVRTAADGSTAITATPALASIRVNLPTCRRPWTATSPPRSAPAKSAWHEAESGRGGCSLGKASLEPIETGRSVNRRGRRL